MVRIISGHERLKPILSEFIYESHNMANQNARNCRAIRRGSATHGPQVINRLIHSDPLDIGHLKIDPDSDDHPRDRACWKQLDEDTRQFTSRA
jgi:hypothetical protein